MSTPEESEWFNPSLELKGSNRACHFARYYFAQKYVINKKVLDIACGSGIGGRILSKVCKTVDGVDNDPSAIDYAMENNFIRTKTFYYVYDALKYINLFRPYDVTVSFETIEHLCMKDIECLFAFIPSKIFVFSVPSEKYMPLSKFHITHIQKSKIISLLLENNFEYRIYYQHAGGRINNNSRNVQNYIFVAYKSGYKPKIKYSSKLWYSSYYQFRCLFFTWWISLKRVGLRLLGRKF